MDTWDNHASTGYAGGNGMTSNPYRIETAGQLAYFAKQSRMTTLNGYYSLEKSLDMSDYLWLGIGSSSYPFMGHFNGNFNTVSGIVMSSKGSYNGFFNYVKSFVTTNTEITNLILTDGTIISLGGENGGVVGRAISLSSSSDYPVGGGVSIENCVVENYTIMSSTTVAGIAGCAAGTDFQYEEDGETYDDYVNVEIYNCVVKDCNLITTTTTTPFMGGITVEGDYKYISTCAVLDVKFITNSTDYSYICPISYYNDYNCYAKTICINNNAGVRRSSKVLSSNFTTNSTGTSSFFYDSGLNKGYPIPKSLIRVGTATKQTHTQVYNYLVGLGFSK